MGSSQVGKAAGFESAMRRFESYLPNHNHLCDIVTNVVWTLSLTAGRSQSAAAGCYIQKEYNWKVDLE